VIGKDPSNEATCCLRLNAILFDCVIAERDWLESRPSRFSGIVSRLSTPPERTPMISLTLESHLSLEVEYKKSRRFLQGKADYSVWYGDGEMDTNFVIIEAKTTGEAASGQAQCLAYMGKLYSLLFKGSPFRYLTSDYSNGMGDPEARKQAEHCCIWVLHRFFPIYLFAYR
jgi:hypothetical protein